MNDMTTEERIAALWEMLREYGIETPEQFAEAYKTCPKIDITPFVTPTKKFNNNSTPL